METKEKRENKRYLLFFTKIYPWFTALSGDLLFYIAVDTLFLTMIKGINASQIALLTVIPPIIAILIQKYLLTIIKKVGNQTSVRIGCVFLVISSVLLTFANSYFGLIIARVAYEIAFIFKNMEVVLLQKNLTYYNKQNECMKLRSKSNSIYAIITALIAFSSGFIYNINPYLPMYACIFLL